MSDIRQQKIDSEAVSYIKKAIFDVFRSMFKHPPDVTHIGHIINTLENKKYEVRIQGTVYTVPSCLEQDLYVGDTVLVLYVQNNSRNKFIMGRVVS